METRTRNGAVLVAAAALALACERGGGGSAGGAAAKSAGDSPVVARIDGEAITLDELQGSPMGGMRGDARPALDAAVARRLAAKEARRRGLDATPEVKAQIAALHLQAAAREDVLLRDALQASLDAGISVTEEELRAQYEKTPARYSEPQMRLRRIAFPTAEAARAEDQRLGPDGRLDPAASEEVGPATLGELMQMQILGVMRLQEPGQRIVVDREGSFALIELVERLPAAPLPFEKVRPQIEIQLRAQRAGEAFAKLLEELRAGARVEIDEAVLAEEAKRAPGFGPGMAPGMGPGRLRPLPAQPPQP